MQRTMAKACPAFLVLCSYACGDDDGRPDPQPLDAQTAMSSDAGAAPPDQLDAGREDSGMRLDAGDGMRSVSIRFKAKLGSQDLVCGKSYPGQGSTGVTATPQNFRFFVQGLRLIRKEDGREEKVELDRTAPFQRPEVALLDFTSGAGSCAASGDSALNTTLTGKVPAGEYDGVVFINGVPEELNHAGPAETAEAPLDDVSMYWGWLSGYRFIIAELLPVSGHDAGAADAGAPTDAGRSADAGHDAGAAHGADGGALGTDGGMHAEDGGMHGAELGAPALVHVGSSACSGGQSTGISCSRKARNEIRLRGFDPAQNVVVADLAEIFKTSDLRAPLQCHGIAPPCAAPYAALGIDMDTGAKTDTQKVFRVE